MRSNSSIIKQCSNRTQDTKTLQHLLTNTVKKMMVVALRTVVLDFVLILNFYIFSLFTK